ncbi:MAG: alpha/beta fold hydrolase, partial [Nitrospinota bacterium]
DYSLGAFADDLAAWAKRLGGRPSVHRTAVVGHSMGGIVALALAERGEVDLRALVVAETPLRVGEEIAGELRELGRRPSRPYKSREEFIAHFRLWPPAPKAEPALIRHVAAHSARRSPEGHYRLKADKHYYRTREVLDTRAGWRGARCPCLLVRGSESDRLPDDQVREIRSLCPQVEVATLEGAHHHLFLEQPEEFVEVLRRFFEGLPPP